MGKDPRVEGGASHCTQPSSSFLSIGVSSQAIKLLMGETEALSIVDELQIAHEVRFGLLVSLSVWY